jgi:thiamine biosynthesis protein ThiI
MMEAAHRIAGRVRANSIVTGESLGQVASQTAENIRFTQSTTSIPVLRPLIGMDKEETIGIARRIGSYEISILPYEDCCVLFSPTHPVLKAEYAASITCYEGLGLKELIIQAVRSAQRVDLSWNEAMQPIVVP